MQLSQTVKKILSNYESDNPGVKSNIARLLCHGHVGNTGRMVIFPVDQGFEHGPDRSFSMNPAAYDPHYFFDLAVEAGVSAFAAPLGLLEAGADTFAGQMPLILKMNSGNTMTRFAKQPLDSDQAITASISDALRLGCSAIGFTVYPGSDHTYEMYEEIRSLSEEAKACGLAVVIWSYARGNMSKAGETSIDAIAYGAHMACLLGASIVKVKLPTEHVEYLESESAYRTAKFDFSTLTKRVEHIVRCCFNGRRLVVFSGGETKDPTNVYAEARAIRDAGGNGSIIGRNCFQRPKGEALELFEALSKIYRDE
jgi:class I fructose-bisphosphate aldolase